LPIRGTLFLNRNAGPRTVPEGIGALLDAAARADLEVVDVATGTNVFQLIRERRTQGVKLFIAAGGDGTVHHVVQGLIQAEEASLGVLPIGTYNHFARDLGIPLDWNQALEVALAGADRQIDVGRVNDRFFVNNVSLGLYPDLVAKREERGRDYPRWKARLYAFWVTLRRYRHVTLAVESDAHQQLIETHVFIVSNNSYDLESAGLEAQRPTLEEGHLSVYWLPHLSRWNLAKFVGRYLAGRLKQVPGFRFYRTRRLRVQSARREIRVGVDGEVFRIATPLVITALPGSLSVRVPRE
jgi:YegS/Rv2252/BmrU family lipid kinase